jgi:hypothetical protein
MVLIQVFLEVLVAQFIALLEPPIVIGVFLNGIIGEMDQVISTILDVVLIRGCSNVTLFIPITLKHAIDTSY